ncbi:head-tail connector protein [Acidaminococcus provencensis]|uniref:head-tail connector protein n=1 Tax=Acidaminococcus provencensis TaxID=2058289 RepID=UPI0022E77951|nr:head-tail connector protein [Acidaminococcus provencensis]
MELKDFKNYLRIDDDLTDDDSMVQALMDSAKEYIENSTGKAWQDDSELMTSCAKLLVAHWYNDRSLVSKSNVQEYNHSITSMLHLIEVSDAYPAKAVTS